MTPLDQFPYRRLFPWLHLFRAFGIALSLRLMLLSGLALAALMLGRELGDGILSSSSAVPEVSEATTPRLTTNTFDPRVNPAVSTTLSDWSPPLTVLAKPWYAVVTVARDVLNPPPSAKQWGRAVFDLIVVAAVWSLFGLAICRLAAIRFARDESGSFRRAVQFGVSRWGRAVSSPMIPLAAAACVMVGILVAAWFGRVPWVGTIWLMLASPGLLAAGFVVAFLLLVAALGWPLMIAAIATDDCDAFGGLSRSYSLWTGRPFHAAWFLVIAAVSGGLVYSLAGAFLTWTLAITLRGATFATGGGSSVETLSQCCGLLVQTLLHSFAISLFWTNTTITYLLLRQSVDQMPLDRIAPDEQERPPRDPLPVVGMPATDAGAAENPPAVG